MNFPRLLAGPLLAFLFVAPPVFADDATPVLEPTSPPVTEPTTPPIVVEPTTPPAPTPVPQPSPVIVAPEENTPVVKITGPATEPTLPTSTQPTSVTEGSVPTPVIPAASPTTPSQSTGTGASGAPGAPAASGGAPTPVSASSSDTSSSGVTSSSSITSYDYNSVSTSAQAPAQLSCGRSFPDADGPFLVSPYQGWTELFSYVDHDLPDYSVDGTIVLANGVTATAADGQESDMFPAYWSPALRQYINYDGHNGYDFGISYQPVDAAAAGTVEYAGWNGPDPSFGYGQMVLINHHNGYVTLYGHLSKLEVKQGDKVQAGQEIAISGSTGHSSGPHLHFSVFHNCHVTDPYGWTGNGTDPLRTFDGEHAEYLWLPGRDPLVVNPLRNWPAYPQGLHIATTIARAGHTSPAAQLPPADRLLLLSLPAPAHQDSTSAALAVTRTEQAVSTELQTLTPILRELRRQGVISTYQVIPAAAAVWVRGSATAAQLEALPGVASLSGVEPRDLEAAQRGFAHAVLIQIGRQQVPSLWPVGFRSALQSWRPVVTAIEQQPLVSGFTQPGAAVDLTLRRHGVSLGSAETTADQTTGGFVAMLHDPTGAPLPALAGDYLTVRSAGKSTSIVLSNLQLSANRGAFVGAAARQASLSLQYTASDGKVQTDVLNTSGDGGFRLSRAGQLSMGEAVVATAGNAAGNQEAVSAVVPGIEVEEGTGMVRGWVYGKHANLVVRRHGAAARTFKLHARPDGAFQLDLATGSNPLTWQVGDHLAVFTDSWRQSVTVPALRARPEAKQRHVLLHGPANCLLEVTYTSGSGAVRTESLTTDDRGNATAPLGPAGFREGDSIELSTLTTGGAQIDSTLEARALIVREGRAIVSGTVRPGAVLSIRAVDAKGHLVGGGVAAADGVHGMFVSHLLDPLGRQMKFGKVARLLVREDGATFTITPPSTAVHIDSTGGVVSGIVHGARDLFLHLTLNHGRTLNRGVTANADGSFRVDARGVRAAVVQVSLPNGVRIERHAAIHRCTSKDHCRHLGTR